MTAGHDITCRMAAHASFRKYRDSRNRGLKFYLQACNRQSLYCVPLYDSLGENAIEYILGHSEASAVFVEGSKLERLATALPHVKGQVSLVLMILLCDPSLPLTSDFESLVGISKRFKQHRAACSPLPG